MTFLSSAVITLFLSARRMEANKQPATPKLQSSNLQILKEFTSKNTMPVPSPIDFFNVFHSYSESSVSPLFSPCASAKKSRIKGTSKGKNIVTPNSYNNRELGATNPSIDTFTDNGKDLQLSSTDSTAFIGTTELPSTAPSYSHLHHQHKTGKSEAPTASLTPSATPSSTPTNALTTSNMAPFTRRGKTGKSATPTTNLSNSPTISPVSSQPQSTEPSSELFLPEEDVQHMTEAPTTNPGVSNTPTEYNPALSHFPSGHPGPSASPAFHPMMPTELPSVVPSSEMISPEEPNQNETGSPTMVPVPEIPTTTPPSESFVSNEPSTFRPSMPTKLPSAVPSSGLISTEEPNQNETGSPTMVPVPIPTKTPSSEPLSPHEPSTSPTFRPSMPTELPSTVPSSGLISPEEPNQNETGSPTTDPVPETPTTTPPSESFSPNGDVHHITEAPTTNPARSNTPSEHNPTSSHYPSGASTSPTIRPSMPTELPSAVPSSGLIPPEEPNQNETGSPTTDPVTETPTTTPPSESFSPNKDDEDVQHMTEAPTANPVLSDTPTEHSPTSSHYPPGPSGSSISPTFHSSIPAELPSTVPSGLISPEENNQNETGSPTMDPDTETPTTAPWATHLSPTGFSASPSLRPSLIHLPSAVPSLSLSPEDKQNKPTTKVPTGNPTLFVLPPGSPTLLPSALPSLRPSLLVASPSTKPSASFTYDKDNQSRIPTTNPSILGTPMYVPMATRKPSTVVSPSAIPTLQPSAYIGLTHKTIKPSTSPTVTSDLSARNSNIIKSLEPTIGMSSSKNNDSSTTENDPKPNPPVDSGVTVVDNKSDVNNEPSSSGFTKKKKELVIDSYLM